MSLGNLGRWILALVAAVTLSYAPSHAASTGKIVSSLDSLSIFAQLAEESGLIQTLDHTGPYTVFAPTDAAFRKLPAGTLDRLRRLENRASLLATLKYHVVPGELGLSDIPEAATEETTLQGGNLYVEVLRDLLIKVNEVLVVRSDIVTNNGVVHLVEDVLLLN